MQMARPVRRFTLLDVLVLIAGIAAGLAFLRWLFAGADLVTLIRKEVLGPLSAPEWTFRECYKRAAVVTLLLAPVLVCLSLAHCILYAVPPRPPWRRLRRQVGFLTSCVSLLVAAGTMAVFFLVWLGLGAFFLFDGEVATAWIASILSPAVAACWLSLLLSGRWRAQNTGLDRLGRALGWIWIACLPISGLLLLLS